MRFILIFAMISLCFPLRAQTVSDSLPPMFNPMNGDEIRKYYQYFRIRHEPEGDPFAI